jgi:hypothetical protein
MLKLVKTLAVACALFAAACAAQAQDDARRRQSMTPLGSQGAGSAKALAAKWKKHGPRPVGGQMIGHFRYWRDGQPQFYEFMVLDVVEGGVRMRLKHFNPDYTTWEDRETWTTFEPVSVSPEAHCLQRPHHPPRRRRPHRHDHPHPPRRNRERRHAPLPARALVI